MHESLKSALFNHPSTFVLIALAWVPAILWTVMISLWMIQGDIDAVVGVLALAAAVVMGVVATAGQHFMLPLMAIIGYSSLIGFPIAKYLSDRHVLTEIEYDAIDRAYEALGQSPTNPLLRFRLAKALYTRGLINSAIAVAETSIGKYPEAAYPEEQQELAGWRTHQREHPKYEYPCPYCGYRNDAGEVFCQQCAKPYLVAIARGKWHSGGMFKKLVSVWIALILVCFGSYLSFEQLNLVYGVLVTLLLIAVSIFSLIQGFKSTEVTA